MAFLFASPASSSANLISSEIFPTGSTTIMLYIMFVNSMLGGMIGVWGRQLSRLCRFDDAGSRYRLHIVPECREEDFIGD